VLSLIITGFFSLGRRQQIQKARKDTWKPTFFVYREETVPSPNCPCSGRKPFLSSVKFLHGEGENFLSVDPRFITPF